MENMTATALENMIRDHNGFLLSFIISLITSGIILKILYDKSKQKNALLLFWGIGIVFVIVTVLLAAIDKIPAPGFTKGIFAGISTEYVGLVIEIITMRNRKKQ